MIGEIDIGGVFIPSLLIWVCVALPVTALVRRVLRWCGFYNAVWHRTLFDLALLVVVVGGVAAMANRWVAQ